MFWELLDHGSLPHWWDYAVFAAGWLVVLAGLVVMVVILRTRPPRR